MPDIRFLNSATGIFEKAKALLFPTGSATLNLSGGAGSTGDVLTKQGDGTLALAAPGSGGLTVLSGGTKIQSGTVTSSGTSGTLTFPSAFATAPIVILTMVLNSTTSYAFAHVRATTTTTFNWSKWQDGAQQTGSGTFHWVAIGT